MGWQRKVYLSCSPTPPLMIYPCVINVMFMCRHVCTLYKLWTTSSAVCLLFRLENLLLSIIALLQIWMCIVEFPLYTNIQSRKVQKLSDSAIPRHAVMKNNPFILLILCQIHLASHDKNTSTYKAIWQLYQLCSDIFSRSANIHV